MEPEGTAGNQSFSPNSTVILNMASNYTQEATEGSMALETETEVK